MERSHDKNVSRHPSVTQIRTLCNSSVAESVATELLWRVHLKQWRHELIEIMSEFQLQPQKCPLKKPVIKVVNSKENRWTARSQYI
jgi:sulfur relay (sulfurtransferase) DsrC/TusE family protein